MLGTIALTFTITVLYLLRYDVELNAGTTPYCTFLVSLKADWREHSHNKSKVVTCTQSISVPENITN
jgi:hypothetical protein